MPKLKKLISIMITLSFLMSMIIVPNTASALSSNDFLIVDADSSTLTLTGSNSNNQVSKNTTVKYTGSQSSIAWYNKASKGSAKSVDLSTIGLSDPTAYSTITFRMYSDAADTINLLIYYTNTSGATGKYVREPYTFSDAAGNVGRWVDVTLDLTDIDGSKHTNLKTAARKLENIQLNRGSWSVTSTYNNNVYIDKIWFSGTPIPDTIPVADAAKLQENSSAFTANADYKRLYANTAEWNGTGFDVTFDASEYNLEDQEYLYQWIYSPEATGEDVTVRIVDSGDSSYVENTFCVDWTGWKLVELNTIDFSGNGELNGSDTFRIMNANSKLYFDKIWFSYMQHATISASDLYSNAGKLPKTNASFKIELSSAISAQPANAINITANGSSFTGFTATKSGNIITVTIPTLESGVNYTVSTKDGLQSSAGVDFTDVVPISFSATETASTAGDITLTQGSGTVSAQATVTADSGDNITLVVAAYDNGSVLDIESISGTGTITTSDVSTSTADEVKAWVVSKKYGVLRSASLQPDNSNVIYQPVQNTTNSFVLNNVFQDGNGFAFDMSYAGAARQAVAVILDSTGNAVIAEDFIIDSDVQYTIAGNTSLPQGAYTAIVALVGDNKAYSAEAFYISAAEEASILQAVNNSTAYTEILALMNANKLLFRVNNMSDNMREHIAHVLFEQKTYATFDDIHTMVSMAVDVLERLNNTDWSELGNLFGTYSIILNSSEAYDKYIQLDEYEKLGLFKKLADGAPYRSFVALRNKILSINDYHYEGTVSGNSSGKDKEYWAQDPEETTDGFTDLGDYSWAVESIYALLQKNVITMPEDSQYRPGDLVTKAEFVKLLVQAIGLNAGENTACYNDVSESDWYSPYFTAAKNAGIVSGDTENNVRPNEPITRQDMAVMVMRAIDALGMEFKVAQDNCRIADFSEVDTYAKDAVRMVMECGIMSGVGDDNYAPKLPTNRASAAVVIARLIKGISNGGVLDIEEPGSSATDITQMEEYVLINKIGVIADNDSVLKSSAVTRREVARAVYNIVKAENQINAQEIESPFGDVDDDDSDLIAITTMVSMGYMSADSGMFRPDAAITMYELSKVAVSVLGYDFMAEHTGGYPVGYMNVMSKLNLTKKAYLDSSTDISNEEFINIIYNVLMAAPVEFSGVSGMSFDGYIVNSDNTLLYHNFKIYELIGLLEADMYSDILVSRPRASKGTLIISGKAYDTKLDDVNGLVGHMVKAYINEDDEEAVAVFSHQTEELVIPGKDAVLAGDTIRYESADGKKKKTERFTKNVSLLYNGRQIAFDATLFENVNGTVTIIDNNEDGIFDVIKIYNYQTIQVSNLSVYSKIIADGLNGRNIVLNSLDYGEEYLIYKNGKKATLDDIKVDDIISYTRVTSPELIIMHVSDNTVTGTAESLVDDEITINGEAYHVVAFAKNRIQLGVESKFHLDIFGTVVAASTTVDMVYAYLYRIYENDNGNVSMKLFTENNRWVELEFADRVVLNNKREDALDILAFFGTTPSTYRQLIRYNVNDDAKITKIFTAQQFTAWSAAEADAMAKDRFRLSYQELNSQYYNTNKCFGTYMPVSDKTKIFLVPPKTGPASQEDFHIISTSVLVSNRQYADVAAYNADETFVADVMVIHDTIDNVYAITNDSSVAPVMVVTKVNLGINPLGEDSFKIFGAYNGSAKISFYTKDTSLTNARTLNPGDIVQLSIDRDGYIIGFDKKFSAQNGFRQYIPASSVYAKDAFMGGKIRSVNPFTKRFVIQCDTSDRGVAASFGANLKIFIYDTQNNEVKLGTTNDLLVGDYVYVGARYLTAQQIVIFR